MRTAFLFTCVALLLVLASAGQGFASSCTVTLKNGNVLTANECRVDGSRLYLKYPVGEVSVPLKDVKAVEGSDAASGFLQSRGIAAPGAKEGQSAVNAQPAAPPQQVTRPPEAKAGGAQVDAGPPQTATRQLTIEEERQSKEVDDFIDRYSSADEQQRAVLDQNMDAILDGLMDVRTAGPEGSTGDSNAK